MTNPRRDNRFNLHREHFFRHIDPASRGLEIGAFDLPMIEPAEGNCKFADYRSTAELKELAVELDGHNPDFVAPVTYELKDGYGNIDQQFDWVAAAHTIEHIPDFVGWLNIIAEKLVTGGLLFLIIPDKRYSFDYFREPTQLAEIVANHSARLTKPSYQQVFDHIYGATGMYDPFIVWNGQVPPNPPYDFSAAQTHAERSLTEYFDVHCTVFTPESFARITLALRQAGLINFDIVDLRTTQLFQADFSIVLMKR